MKTVLYLGLDAPQDQEGKHFIHFPIIEIVPRNPEHAAIVAAFADLPDYTHLIFTSKSAVRLFFNYLPLFGYLPEDLAAKKIIAIGQATAENILSHGGNVWKIAETETAEGVIDVLKQGLEKTAYLFWPHSAQSRSVIDNYLKLNNLKHKTCIFYDTKTKACAPFPLTKIDEIVFTSPSTIDGYIEVYGALPTQIPLTTIGPITQAHLDSLLT